VSHHPRRRYGPAGVRQGCREVTGRQRAVSDVEWVVQQCTIHIPHPDAVIEAILGLAAERDRLADILHALHAVTLDAVTERLEDRQDRPPTPLRQDVGIEQAGVVDVPGLR
jgi:hypothetical protein